MKNVEKWNFYFNLNFVYEKKKIQENNKIERFHSNNIEYQGARFNILFWFLFSNDVIFGSSKLYIFMIYCIYFRYIEILNSFFISDHEKCVFFFHWTSKTKSSSSKISFDHFFQSILETSQTKFEQNIKPRKVFENSSQSVIKTLISWYIND